MRRILLLVHSDQEEETHRVLDCVQPYENADHVLVKDWGKRCPHCGIPAETGVAIAGAGLRASKDDQAWEADAATLCCLKRVGILRVETGTLFGVREDAAVLSGRWRVY